ncbi:protein-disulfide reductase DsbD domain-containing protein [Pseudodonghicola flavimaris]|uniref:Protein-disulfide reductase DsbD family protein n=1 Tax=Pseudodonghicola flavimaris TaxID=3050036 RepID=A0ABT7EY24_9RHOB|nr:protein-disulfide reductase DsbD domain-containing protein [Pseudodonghicola flavimaris]MDK3017238.1 protein-disulfide reductase DsbD family protein [Pseudodonghicola flavimaris]
MTRFAALIALCTAFAPVLPGAVRPAAAADRSDLDKLVTVDVIDGGPTARGTYMAALRLTLSDGWKTYWRAPGEAGIPPSFDWKGSRNLGEVSMTWPTPKVFDSNGMQTIGYTRQLVLPVEITPARDGRPIELRGRIELGLCSDVCIPGTVSFDHRVDPEAGRNPAIVAALAERPYSAREAGVRAATCRLQPSADGLRVEARITMPSAGGPEVAVIESGTPGIWATETETSRQGNTLIAASDLIAETGGAFALDRSALRITVLGSKHAVDIRGCDAG